MFKAMRRNIILNGILTLDTYTNATNQAVSSYHCMWFIVSAAICRSNGSHRELYLTFDV